MKNESCKALYRYWDEIRGDRPAPPRTAIEPSEISSVLRDTFILQSSETAYPFRLAGTRLCAAFGRELKGAKFLDLWAATDRAQMAAILEAVAEDGRAAVVGISGFVSRRREVAFELLLLPLIQSGPRFDRVLGAMVPMELPYWLGLEPLIGQSISSARLLWPDEERQPAIRPVLRPAVTTAPTHLGAEQRRQRFVVLEGGKSGR
jgi:hypothetical protein